MRVLLLALALILLPSAAYAGPLVGVVAGALATAIGVSVATAKIIVAVVVGVALAAAQFFLAPKPKKPSGLSAFAQEAHSYTVEVRQPTVSRKYVVGEHRVPGVWVFADIVNDNLDLWMVFYLCQGEVDSIPCVLLGDYPVYPADLDGDGWITTGRYTNKVRIKKHLGADDQAADSDLVSASSKWTSDHRLRGACYIIVQFKYDRDLFANGRPEVTAIVRGSKFIDPRDTASPQVAAWTPNAAVCLRGYLRTDKKGGGYGVKASEVNDDSVTTAANICDEIVDTDEVSHEVVTVNTSDDSLDLDDDALKFQTGDRLKLTTTGTLPSGLSGGATRYYAIVEHIRKRDDDGSTTRRPRIKLASSLENAYAGTAVSIPDTGTGTHTVTRDGEPRYTCDGVIDTAKEPGGLVREMLTAMAGRAVWTGGEFVFHAGAWQAANLTFSEGDFRGPVTVATKHSRKERYNALKGNYSGPDNLYQPSTYPAVTNSTFETEDNNERILFDYDLPYTARQTAAQRVAKIELFRHRRQRRASIPMKLRGYQAAAAGTVAIDYEARGWENGDQTFEVTAISLETVDTDDGPYTGTHLELAESDSAVFDWDHAADEQPVNRPSPSTLGNPRTVLAPTIGTLESGTDRLYLKDDGTVVSRLYVPWTASSDPFLDGYEVAVKKSADSDWPPAVRVSSDQQFFHQWDVEDDVAYDARVRAVNELGRRSDWSTATGHTIVGKTAAPSDVDTFNVTRLADGTRRFIWTHANVDADVRAGGGYQIKYRSGTGHAWADLNELHNGLLKAAPFETNELAAGTWTFGIKAVDSSGNESENAIVIEATLGDPRLREVLIRQDEYDEEWPGSKDDTSSPPTTTAFVNYEGHLEAFGSDTWADLGASWSALADTWREIVANASPLVYTTEEFDVGSDLSFTPIVSTEGFGSITVEMQTGTDADGGVTGSFVALASVENVRYIKIRATVTGTTPYLRSLVTILDAAVQVEDYEDVDTSAATSGRFERIATGHFKLATRGNTATIVSATIRAFQNAGSGWTWELLSKSTTITGDSEPAVEMKIYKNGTLTDATVDVEIKGPKAT